MFLENPLAVDAFDRLFRELDDGSLVFQPKRSATPVPVEPEEYDALREAYGRMHARHQMILMATGALAGAYGLYSVIMKDSYSTFFWVIGSWFVLNFAAQVRDIEGLVWKQIQKQRTLVANQSIPND